MFDRHMSEHYKRKTRNEQTSLTLVWLKERGTEEVRRMDPLQGSPPPRPAPDSGY